MNDLCALERIDTVRLTHVERRTLSDVNVITSTEQW